MPELPFLDPDEQRVEVFLTQLMQINSTTGNEGLSFLRSLMLSIEDLSTALTQYFTTTGWHVLRQPLKSDPKRHNLLVTRIPYKPPGPRYLMNTHMDTVPPYIPPACDGIKVSGRGANDAKGQLAAMIFAAQQIAKEDPVLAENIGLLFVVSEELDHIGMVEANSLGAVPEFFMIGEPTELKFGRLQKGAVKVTLKVHGKAAHSGYPHMGATTVNIGLISGGEALNALAEHASAAIFFRVTTSTSDILQQLEEIVDGRAEIDQSFGKNEPIRLTAPPAPYESEVVAFNTDLPYFIARNKLKAAYLFGAGSITNAHSKDEHVLVEDLKKAVEIHVDIFKYTLKAVNNV
ncbi:unnamed protein product [Gongylonema pulchrum]|uniref:M20_dimer domain-containing protein n=1 Tax=Gongylonema pulchrum TaxID=637853 RepID=A0A183EDL3_9BILA|nr:unnamed protein product [Gongylonema pulchrum]